MATNTSTRSRVQVPQQAIKGAYAGQVRRDFFVYAIALTANAGQATQGAIQIQADSDFELQKLSFYVATAAAPQTASSRILADGTIQITDTGTGRQVFNTPVPIPAIMGDGQIPFILPVTKIFSANASVAFSLSNFGAADFDPIYILLIGAKLFTY